MSENRTYYYARVSSAGQNLARQLDEFYALGASERDIITDKASGKDIERAGYLALRNTILRSGDTLVVKSLDRLSRRKADIHSELQFYKQNNIRVKILDLPTTMIDFPASQAWVGEMVNNILIEVLGTIAEQERITIKERQAQGIKSAHNHGVKFGRAEIQKPANWDEVIGAWRRGSITAKSAMERTGLKRTTFYKMIKEVEQH